MKILLDFFVKISYSNKEETRLRIEFSAYSQQLGSDSSYSSQSSVQDAYAKRFAFVHVDQKDWLLSPFFGTNIAH